MNCIDMSFVRMQGETKSNTVALTLHTISNFIWEHRFAKIRSQIKQQQPARKSTQTHFCFDNHGNRLQSKISKQMEQMSSQKFDLSKV